MNEVDVRVVVLVEYDLVIDPHVNKVGRVDVGTRPLARIGIASLERTVSPTRAPRAPRANNPIR